MWSTIEMLNAGLAANPGGVVVKAFAFSRDAYEGHVSLKSLDQSQLHVCHESEVTTALRAVGGTSKIGGTTRSFENNMSNAPCENEHSFVALGAQRQGRRKCPQRRVVHPGHNRRAHEHSSYDDHGPLGDSLHKLPGVAENGKRAEGGFFSYLSSECVCSAPELEDYMKMLSMMCRCSKYFVLI